MDEQTKLATAMAFRKDIKDVLQAKPKERPELVDILVQLWDIREVQFGTNTRFSVQVNTPEEHRVSVPYRGMDAAPVAALLYDALSKLGYATPGKVEIAHGCSTKHYKEGFTKFVQALYR